MWFEVRFKALLVRHAVADGKLYTEGKKKPACPSRGLPWLHPLVITP